jgi:hypothetical protein
MKQKKKCPHCGKEIEHNNLCSFYETDFLANEMSTEQLNKKLLDNWEKLLPFERDVLRYIGLYPKKNN